MKKGKILIYKDEEGLGLIKFGKNKYCRFYKKNLIDGMSNMLNKDREVLFELDICDETSQHISQKVKIIK